MYLSDSYTGGGKLLSHIRADDALKRVMQEKSLVRADQTNLERLMLLGAKWENLVGLLGNEGADKVAERLRAYYGLTPDAAMAITKALYLASTGILLLPHPPLPFPLMVAINACCLSSVNMAVGGEYSRESAVRFRRPRAAAC